MLQYTVNECISLFENNLVDKTRNNDRIAIIIVVDMSEIHSKFGHASSKFAAACLTCH